TTNEISRSLIEPIRYLSMVIVAVSLCFLLVKKKISYGLLVAVVFYFMLLAWGLILSFFNDAIGIGSNGIFVNVIVTISGFLLIILIKDDFSFPEVARYYVAYVFLGLIVTIFIKGLDLSFPPRFIFEYVGDIRD